MKHPLRSKLMASVFALGALSLSVSASTLSLDDFLARLTDLGYVVESAEVAPDGTFIVQVIVNGQPFQISVPQDEADDFIDALIDEIEDELEDEDEE